MATTTIFIAGNPVTQGSMKAVPNKMPGGEVRGARIVHVEDVSLRGWRGRIADRAQDMGVQKVGEGPVQLKMSFRLKAPTGLPKTKKSYATKNPDVDKLARAVMDALTGIAYRDDSQVIGFQATKRYAEPNEPTGLELTIIDVLSEPLHG